MRELLNGVYDLHIHTSPDVVPRKYSDLELARRLAERGMAGCAIKCHYFDTAARAGLLMAQFPQLDVAGGVTLNRSVGGLNPDAVERSAQAGGRMVWFPTLEAQSYQRYQHRNDPEAGLSRFLTVCDEEGKLLPQALEVLDIAARHHMVVGTGHVGAEEGMALVRAAAERNCTIVLTHADNPADCYSVEQQEEGKAPAEAGKASSRFSVSDLLEAITSVGKNKALRWFFVPVVFFYITWQLDWSMWYLGQVKYCKMSEMTLSICNGVFNIGQLAAVGMIAKVVRKKSPDFALIFAGIGLCFCPVIMILAPHLPLAYRGVAFIVLMTVLNAPQCAVALCTVQILLNAAPEKNRSLLISLFTMMTTLTNSVLPLLGVRLYTALGADLTALYRFNLIDLGVRILSTLGLVWRYQKAKKDGFLTKISD